MAQWHEPREITRNGEKIGRWHYTVQCGDTSNSPIYPEGYCADPNSACCEAGHESSEEAAVCKLKYDCDKAVYRDDQESKLKCAKCGEWTHGRGLLADGYEEIPVCDKHKTASALLEIQMEKRSKK